MRHPRVPHTMRVVLAASAMTTLGTLPVFLLSSQSVFVRDELGFDERHFGLAVSAFFAAAAASALLGGGLVDRLGQRRGTMVAGLLAAAGGFGLAGAARSWPVLVVLMVVLGVANAACQVTSNLTMARAVPPHRRGLGFGVKQAAIPFAIRGEDRPPLPPLLMTMVAVTCASAAANSFGSFIASWGFQVGLTPSEAGALMAAGSGMNIVARVVTGHLADRRHGRNLPVVAAQMTVGAIALVALSVPSVSAVVAAGFVAFALGWSWPGLLLYAVVRIGREAPARASGLVQAGAFAGGATGPAVFGMLVSSVGYEVAWRIAAAGFLVAVVLVMTARRMFIADLAARPPVSPIMYGGRRGVPARMTDPREPEGPAGESG